MIKRQIIGWCLLFGFILAWHNVDVTATKQLETQQSLMDYTTTQIGGWTNLARVQGDVAYVSIGPRVNLFDVVDPANPVLLGTTEPLEGLVQDLFIEGDYAYVILSDALLVLDVSNPANPNIVGSFPAQGGFREVDKQGDLLFIAEARRWENSMYMGGGVRVVDVSNPAGITEVGYYTTDQSMAGIALYQNYAYVLTRTGGVELRILDISDPTNLVEVGDWNSFFGEGGYTIEGDYLYFSAGFDGVIILDLSDPTNPDYISSMNGGTKNLNVTVSNDKAYVIDAAKIVIFDVANPAMPVELGSHNIPGLNALDLAVAGNHLITAYDREGLRVVDATDPANPQEVYHFEQLVYAPGRLAISGDHLITLDYENGLRILNHPNPNQIIGSLDTLFRTGALTIDGTTAFVGNYNSQLSIIDFSDPSNPYKRSEIYTGGGAMYDIAVRGGYAFLANSTEGLSIVDVSDLDNPIVVSTDDTVTALTVADNETHIFVGDYGGLRIIDVGDPTLPQEVGFYSTDKSVRAVDVVGTTVYMGDAFNGLKILDVSDPTTPTEIGFYPAEVEFDAISVIGNAAYISLKFDGVLVVDISDPANVVETFAYNTVGFTADTLFADEVIYVADGVGGLYYWQEFVEFNQFLPAILHN